MSEARIYHGSPFTEEVRVMSIPKIVGGMSSGVVLCASLSGTPQAKETINPKECSELKGGHRDLVQCEEDRKQGIDTVKGEVLRIGKRQYVVQRFYGKTMQLNTDASTQVTGTIGLGDSIEAKVIEENETKHVLSIRRIK
jgi:hypothetical protein